MTDQDLRVQLAALQASLEHIRGEVSEMRRESKSRTQSMETLGNRMTAMETTMRHDTEVINRIGDAAESNRDAVTRAGAVQGERERAGDNLRANLAILISLPSVIATIVTLVVLFVMPGGPTP